MFNTIDMWCILGRGTTNGGLAVGTIINLKLGLQPAPFGESGYAPWQGGDFTKDDEPPGKPPFCQTNGTFMITSLTSGVAWSVARPMAASWLAPSSLRSSACSPRRSARRAMPPGGGNQLVSQSGGPS